MIDERDGSIEPEMPQFLGRAVPRGPGSDDCHRPRQRSPTRHATPNAARRRLLSRDEHTTIPLDDRVARNRVERRCPQSFARAKAEAGVVPGTADGVVDDEPLGQGPAVVAARRADRRDRIGAADQDDRTAPDVTEQGNAVGE